MKTLAIAAALVCALLVLRDPPWAGAVSSGFRSWEEESGTRFRWTAGRASFFVPAAATSLTLPLRTLFTGPLGSPTEVQISSDDRWLATVLLPDLNVWVKTTLPIGGRTNRRYRRIDLRVNRVVPPFMLGVMVGEVRADER
jgi:hypothetical protein